MQLNKLNKKRNHRLIKEELENEIDQTSVNSLKSSQLSAMKSLAGLLLKEVELLKNSEEEFSKRIKSEGISLYDEMRRFEINMIRSALIQAGGIQCRAAKMLGLKTTTLNVKIKRYKIDLLNLRLLKNE